MISRRSIRTHILLMVLVAAILPLAVIGALVTRSALQSGRELLRTQLERAAQTTADAVSARWEFRRGELSLLAANVSARRVLGAGQPSRADLEYLAGVFRQLAHTVPSFSYRDTLGRVRWSSAPLSLAATDPSRPATAAPAGVSLPIVRDVVDDAGYRVGFLDARVALSSLVATDSGRIPVPGAELRVRDAHSGATLVPTNGSPLPLDSGEMTVGGDRWLAASRQLAEPPLEIVVAAPMAPYVTPFARAAQIGFAAVLIVALGALLLTTYLTMRITTPIERLAEASTAVAKGDLDRRVAESGPAELLTLATSFNAMTDSLRRTIDELSRRSALAAVGEFAASLAHEVRNALTSVKVDLQRAEEKLDPSTPSGELVSRSLSTVTHLNETVTGALRVARSGSVRPEQVDIQEVLRTAAERARPMFAAAKATIDAGQVDGSGPALWVRGDGGALEQLFLNVMINAAQAVAPGGRATIHTPIVNGTVIVRISDNGPGIAADDLPRALEPFYTTRTAGTGLGLPIARRIAIAHGGDLSLTSEVGRGTTVEVMLPRFESAATPR